MIAILGRSSPTDPALARSMLGAAPHRGSCVTVRVCGNCVLGVSNQPGTVDAAISRDGPVTAAFKGHLDNATELARALTDLGVPPASPAAADVVVSAFKAFGPDAPNRMRGPFAGMVTDGRSLWCFRDHVGFQPMFYRDDPRAFFAATEAKQVLAGADLAPTPDLEVLERILYGRMPADTPCALKGVSRLPQGTTLTVSQDRPATARRFWQPEDLVESSRLGPDDTAHRFAELFEQAVARSMSGDDVIALSGGLDSTAVAAFAAPRHRALAGRPIAALSAVFPDLPRVDESRYIELASAELGIELHTFVPQARTLDDLQRWCVLLDGPAPVISVPGLNENYARARALGYRNVLTGEFAEFVVDSRGHLLGHLLTHGKVSALFNLISAERRHGTSWKTIVRELLLPFVPGRLANWYLRARHLNRPRFAPDWIEPRKFDEVPGRFDLLPPSRSRWSALQLLAFQGSTITLEADEVCARLNGVTVRYPFADVDLWEFFLSLPAEHKFPDLRSKTLMRRLLGGRVPNAVLQRRDKTAFDDHVSAQMDYPTLRRFLIAPRHGIDGVDYRRLAERLERADFGLFDWVWAKDLALIHAFLSQW